MPIIKNTTQVDSATQVFDQFYNFETQVNASEYELVYSYLLSVLNDPKAAENFTASLYRVSTISNIAILDLLEELKGKSGLSLTATLAYFLNTVRDASNYLGVTVPRMPVRHVARNVRS